MNPVSAREHHKICDEISLALLANGGAEWDQRHCECDPSSNSSPCRYCSIHRALDGSLNRQLETPVVNPEFIRCLEAEIEMRSDWIAKMNAILGYDNSDGFHSSPDPFEIAQSLVNAKKPFWWMPRRTDPTHAGWYYVREVQPRLCVGIRYFDDSKGDWWAVSKDGKNDGSLVPNGSFHDWLTIPNISDRQRH